MKTYSRHHTSKRGSVLVVTVLLATGMALAIGSFITLTVESVKLSNRSYFANSVLNLAEAGIEDAISSLNRSDWTGWTTHSSGGNNKTRIISWSDLGQGTSGQVKVVVYGITGTGTPRIVAEGRASPSLGPAITKQLEVKLGRRSHWATGVVAKDLVTFSGSNGRVDSYNSDIAPYTPDPNGWDTDRGTVASLLIDSQLDPETGVAVQNSQIYGFVSTGGADVDVGSQGKVFGADSPGGAHDSNRISKDFSADLTAKTMPTGVGIWHGTSLDNNDTLTGSNNPSAPLTYTTNEVANSNNQTITINGHVVLRVLQTIDIKGQLVIAPNSSLTIYVAGNVAIGGNGIVNQTTAPKHFILYGTDTEPGRQEINLHGNGVLYGAVYAPNADISLKGGGNSGEMFGSAVGFTVKITGNYRFHYDEALSSLSDGNPYGLTRWRELVSADERVTL